MRSNYRTALNEQPIPVCREDRAQHHAADRSTPSLAFASAVLVMGATGLEHLAKTTGKTNDSKAGGAESGAVGSEIGPIEPDLRRLIDAWPTLPDALKTGIVAMVEAAAKSDGEA